MDYMRMKETAITIRDLADDIYAYSLMDKVNPGQMQRMVLSLNWELETLFLITDKGLAEEGALDA